MKRSHVLAIAVVGLSVTVSASRQTTKDLEPSLKFLGTVSTAMPSPVRVPFYEAFPDSGGRVVAGIGHSHFVRGWFRQMEPMLARFAKMDQALRAEVEFYADTVKEEGELVLGAQGDLKAGLKELHAVTNGRVLRLLREYNDSVRATLLARREFEAARKEADAAGYLLKGSSEAVEQCNAILERKRVEAEKAALLKEMQGTAAILDAVEGAIGTVAGGPQTIAAFVTAEVKSRTITAAKEVLLDAFHAGTRERLYDLAVKIDAIDRALAELECKKEASSLNAAKSTLEARMIRVAVAHGKLVAHRANAWGLVDELGSLLHPKTQKPLTFFARLKDYNEEINKAGSGLFAAVNEYLALLARDPLSRGERVLAYVKEDVQTVERERQKRDPSGAWLSRATQTRAYLETYDKWYGGEVRRGQVILEDLREGRHLDFVDRMLARATRELGSTVSYEHIIKSNTP